MIYGSLTTAIILIFSGLIVKNNPDLIAGYNTLFKKEKEKIDTNKLTHITCKYLVLTGISVLMAGVVLYFLKVSEKTQLYLVCGIVILGVVLLIIQSNRLNLMN